VNDGVGNGVSCGGIKVMTDRPTMKLSNLVIASFGLFLEMAEIWSKKVWCSSKMKPRLQAEWVVLSEELCILSTCFVSTNSVLEELRVGRLFRRVDLVNEQANHWFV